MSKKFIGVIIAAVSLLAWQAPALAQVGSSSFALPDFQNPTSGRSFTRAGTADYYNYYRGPVAPAPSARIGYRHRKR